MSRDLWEEDRYEGQGPGLAKKIAIGIGALAGLVVLATVGFLIVALQGIPGLRELQNYEPPITSRVHAGDGALVAEFAEEHRLFVPIQSMPDHVREAFVAAEDQNFFEHSGVDFTGVVRAMISNVGNVVSGRRLEGASTITQQVAGNMLTGRASNCAEESGFNKLFCAVYTKVREGIAAQRIEQGLDKERILELYLNQIYLGQRAYGVAAASLNYFDKPLSELTIAEAAYLAALPKGPNNYHPIRQKERAIARRNYVIGRMEEQGFITAAEAQEARNADLVTTNRLAGDQYVAASHFVEEIRRIVSRQMGDEALLRGGLSIRSTLDTRLQLAAARALRTGIDQYDRRHAWRGPVGSGEASGDIPAQLRQAAGPPSLTSWTRAMVTASQGANVRVTTESGARGRLVDADAQWAAQHSRGNNRARALVAGSIIYVQRVGESERYNLRQVPELQGAIVAMDPHTGRVRAMVGGYSFAEASGLNRATQARRQPGSAFKPIVYAAALDFGLTPATLIDDGPLAIEAGDGSVWSPENYTQEYYGPTTLRRGLELSRNAMTARVAYEMGIDRVVQYAQRMGVYDEGVQPVFALALGTGETTLLRMTTAYGEFVNGGRRIQPILVDRIQDRSGASIFRGDQRDCPNCDAPWRNQGAPRIADTREQIIDPVTAYQIVSMSEGVVQRGTATVVNSLGMPLGGKTGTTQDYRDAWFVGFSPDLVVGVWVGFDQPRSMGEGETGARIPAPIFRDFMRAALEGVPPTPFRIPSGVRLVRVDATTGLLPSATSTNTILEAFRPDTEPTQGAGGGSPFVFGGADPIDPRLLTGLQDFTVPTESAAQGQQAQTAPAGQQSGGDDSLSGLY